MIHLRMQDIPGVDRSRTSKIVDHPGDRSMMGSTLVCLELPIDRLRQLPLEMSTVIARIAPWPHQLQGQINTNKIASISHQYHPKITVSTITAGRTPQFSALVNLQRQVKAAGHLTDIVHHQCKMDVRDKGDRLVVDHLQLIIVQDPPRPLPCHHQIRMHYHHILRRSDPV